MSVEIIRQGKVIHRSRNLRGLLDYARRNSVQAVSINRLPEGAMLIVRFFNGATCSTAFADCSVCIGWIKARRSWDIAAIAINQDSATFEAKQ